KLWYSVIGLNLILSVSSIAFAANIAKNYEDQFSAKNLVSSLKRQINTDKTPIFIYQEFEDISSLAFYLKNPLKIIDSQSKDLWYGSKFDQKKIFFTIDTFDTTFQNKDCYVILNKKKLPEFYEKIKNCDFYPILYSGEWLTLRNY